MLSRSPLSIAVRRALSGVAIAGTAAGLPNVLMAQDQNVAEVVVTGSRISADPNLITSSPVTQVKAEELVYAGVTRIEDFINDLPQITPELTSNESNGATGTATLDLRGLTSDRTLVLTNGHRMGFGDPIVLAPDVNQVPSALVERVEVLTGGASSTYGSDAVAGVVNFIMKRDFEGIQFDYQYSGYDHKNDNAAVQQQIANSGFLQAPSSTSAGGTRTFNLIVGTNTENGNITGYLGYRNIDSILQSEYDFSACSLSATNGRTCGGSATSATGLFTDFGTGIGSFQSTVNPNLDPYFFPGPGMYFTVAGNQFTPGVPLYNFGPLNYFQRPDERYTAGLFGYYSVNEKFEGYTEVQFMDDRSLAQIAPSGAFFVTGSINCANPFLSPQQFATICQNDRVPDVVAGSPYYDNPMNPGDAVADFRAARLADGFTNPEIDQMIAQSQGVQSCENQGVADACTLYIGRRNVEGGPRFDDLRHTSYRFLGGFRGDVSDSWSYDVFANFSRLVYSETYQNDMSTTRIVRALNVAPGPGGAPTCQSVLDGSDPTCVPWNVFQTGGATQAAIDYLTLPLFSKAELTQDQVVGFVKGDLSSIGVKSPVASDGIEVVVGAEYRDEAMDYDTDQGFQSGDGAGQGGPTPSVAGGIDATEFFAEMRVPIVEDRPGFQSLSLDLRYRYSDYSTGVTADTYNIGGEYTPVVGFKLRGGFSRAVRAANINELFEPQSFGLWSGIDPCGPAMELTQAECANTGLGAAQYGSAALVSPAGQYNAIFGGNPNLEPEKSDSITVGFVFTPEFLPTLQLSVDYWSIEVDEAISTVDPEFIIRQCGATGDPALCNLIARGPNGNLWVGQSNVLSTQVNIGFFDVAGIDVNGGYRWDLGESTLNFAYRATILDKFDQQEVPGAQVVECAGVWGSSCGRPRPEYKHTFVTTWVSPWGLTLVGGWRHVGKVDELSTNVNAFNAGAQDYFDLSATYTKDFGFGETQFALGVTNVLDNEPPVNGRFGNVSVYGNGNTIPGTWDALGRYYFLGLTHQF